MRLIDADSLMEKFDPNDVKLLDTIAVRYRIVTEKTIQPATKVGKLEKGRYRSVDQVGETYDDGEAVVCSVCGNAFKLDYCDSRWNFCPQCGNRMLKEGE